MSADLFNESALPFNLAGESQSSELTAEGEARVRALAQSEARKAQYTFGDKCPTCGVDWKQHSWATFEECNGK